MGLRVSWQYLKIARVPLAREHKQAHVAIQRTASLHHHRPTSRPVMLEDAAERSPQPVSHLSDSFSRNMHIWRSFCRAAGLLLFLLAQRRRQRVCCWLVALPQPPPGLLVYWPVSWYLLHTLDTVLTDTDKLLATARSDVPS